MLKVVRSLSGSPVSIGWMIAGILVLVSSQVALADPNQQQNRTFRRPEIIRALAAGKYDDLYQNSAAIRVYIHAINYTLHRFDECTKSLGRYSMLDTEIQGSADVLEDLHRVAYQTAGENDAVLLALDPGCSSPDLQTFYRNALDFFRDSASRDFERERRFLSADIVPPRLALATAPRRGERNQAREIEIKTLIERIERGPARMLRCQYISKKQGHTHVDDLLFWYQAPPPEFFRLLSMIPDGLGSAGALGLRGLEECPESREAAFQVTLQMQHEIKEAFGVPAEAPSAPHREENPAISISKINVRPMVVQRGQRIDVDMEFDMKIMPAGPDRMVSIEMSIEWEGTVIWSNRGRNVAVSRGTNVFTDHVTIPSGAKPGDYFLNISVTMPMAGVGDRVGFQVQ